MQKPLHIPSGKHTTGLTVYCYRCKTNVSELCRETGKPIARCPFGDRHAFKVYVSVPKTKNERRTKKLDTRDVNEAVIQAIQFEKEVKEGSSMKNSLVESKEQHKELESGDVPRTVANAMARYIGWLNNEDVPPHMQKQRTPAHIKEVERAFRLFAECVEKNGWDISTLNIDEIKDRHVGKLYEFLQEKQYAGKTFNKFIGHLVSFNKWYSVEHDIPLSNPFRRVTRKQVNTNPEAITEQEYRALLDNIKPETGIREYGKGKNETSRDLYRPWLADGIKLGLETGRRREEICNLKFNQIFSDEHGNACIKIEDFKVNRIQGREDDQEKKYVFIPVTGSLQKLLNELGYEERKDQDAFILAPDEQVDRHKVMPDILSKGFSHYYRQLNTGKNLGFKSLRKTYITGLSVFMGGNARAITQHASDDVIEKHYIDKKVIAKAAQGFSVFGAETDRKHTLKQIRDTTNEKQKTIELDK